MEQPKFCPHCGAERVGAMQFCASCGKRLVGDVPSEPTKSGLSKDWKIGLIIGGCFLLVFGGSFLAQAFGFIAPTARSTAPLRGPATVAPVTASDAWLDCKSFVTKALKAPTSAQFPLASDTGMLIGPMAGRGQWSVIGYVDAQNVLGVQLRQHFTCQVTYNGDKVLLNKLIIEGQTLVDR